MGFEGSRIKSGEAKVDLRRKGKKMTDKFNDLKTEKHFYTLIVGRLFSQIREIVTEVAELTKST